MIECLHHQYTSTLFATTNESISLAFNRCLATPLFDIILQYWHLECRLCHQTSRQSVNHNVHGIEAKSILLWLWSFHALFISGVDLRWVPYHIHQTSSLTFNVSQTWLSFDSTTPINTNVVYNTTCLPLIGWSVSSCIINKWDMSSVPWATCSPYWKDSCNQVAVMLSWAGFMCAVMVNWWMYVSIMWRVMCVVLQPCVSGTLTYLTIVIINITLFTLSVVCYTWLAIDDTCIPLCPEGKILQAF
jgi:hypothetical protein